MRHPHTRRVPPPVPERRRPPHHHPVRKLDPVLTRKGVLSHPGRIVMALAGLLFGAYVFNLGGTQTKLDRFFRELERTLHHYDASVGTGFLAGLPVIGALGLVLAILLILSGMRKGATVVKKAHKLRGRDVLTVHQFVATAREEQIGVKVAREAYHLLLPYYKDRMRALPSDRLAEDLHLSPLAIHDLHANLLRMTDRQRNLREDAQLPTTVLDLMQAVNRLEDRSLTVSKASRRAAFVPVAQRVAKPARDQSFIRPAHLPKVVKPDPTKTGTDG